MIMNKRIKSGSLTSTHEEFLTLFGDGVIKYLAFNNELLELSPMTFSV